MASFTTLPIDHPAASIAHLQDAPWVRYPQWWMLLVPILAILSGYTLWSGWNLLQGEGEALLKLDAVARHEPKCTFAPTKMVR
jgi:hypothetical protein